MGQAKKETNGMLQVQKIRKFFARYLISCDIKKKATQSGMQKACIFQL